MTYKITVPNSNFKKWQSWDDYLRGHMYSSFPSYLTGIYNIDIISAEYSFGFDEIDLSFKSEAHYTWFLLQQ